MYHKTLPNYVCYAQVQDWASILLLHDMYTIYKSINANIRRNVAYSWSQNYNMLG